MKLGRNELCFCGGGLKFKKCCLATRNVAAGPALKTRPEFTVPAVIVGDVVNEIFSLSNDVLFQRLEAADCQPTLCAFIRMLAGSLPSSAVFRAALNAFAIIWMFDQHYQPRALPKIDFASTQRCFERNATSVLDCDNPYNTTMSGRNQPYIHKFIADTILDFDEDDSDGSDLFTLFTMLKTTVDVLHEARFEDSCC